ncbi:MAG: hypothetical protein IPH66_00815 [Crocinitomicaceae bacterium]|nr:hypothetical protein [Crocinitomicaceae bacterium]
MKLFNSYRYHLIAVLLIVLLFIITVLIRKENHEVPLSRHHEWITAHTLITCEIWYENGGPSAYHYSPVYTYAGSGNNNRSMLGGVVDDKGNVYYISYPPFAFLFAYYSTQIFGKPDTDSIRKVNLMLHFICAVLIYFIGFSLSPGNRWAEFSMGGFIGAFLYLFSSGNLWAHGNLYFADMLVQIFIMLAVLLIILFLKLAYQREWIMLSFFGAVFFLATYTEWLGLFMAFITGIVFLILFFRKKEYRFLRAFMVIGFSSTLALTITLYQFSSIAGWENYKTYSLLKFNERSGRDTEQNTPGGFTTSNPASYEKIKHDVNVHYKMPEIFFVCSGIGFFVLLLIGKIRRKMANLNVSFTIILIVTMSIFLHYLIFFNFNTLHDFSTLKTGFLIMLFVLVFYVMMQSALHYYVTLTIGAATIFLGYYTGTESVEKYFKDFPLDEVDWNRIETAEKINEMADTNTAVFVNVYPSPELVYACKHNIQSIGDTSAIPNFMKAYKNKSGQYYHHTENKLQYMQEFIFADKKMFYCRRIDFIPTESGGSLFQK